MLAVCSGWMTDETDSATLVDRAQAGDRGAFAELVRRHQRRAYRTAFHVVGHHGDADDCVQEAFVRAFRGLGNFDRRADFSTWLHRIVVNVGLNLLRSRKRRQYVVALEDAETAARIETQLPDPARRALGKDELTRTLAALAELAEPLRVTLVLATVEEMAYKDVAAALGIPEGTVAWRVNQARKQLRETLAPDLDEAAAEEKTNDLLRRTRTALGAP
jgi:RNA polymerase sigma-70 factor (ECF subfamily)